MSSRHSARSSSVLTIEQSAMASRSDKEEQRRRATAWVRLNTQVGTQPLVEAPQSVPVRKVSSTTPSRTSSRSLSSRTSSSSNDRLNASIYTVTAGFKRRKTGRSTDMCGQFEDLVGVNSPYHKQSARMPVSAAAKSIPPETNDHREGRPSKYQHRAIPRPLDNLPIVANQDSENVKPDAVWPANLSSFLPKTVNDLDRTASGTIDTLRPELYSGMNDNGDGSFMPEALRFSPAKSRTQKVFETLRKSSA